MKIKSNDFLFLAENEPSQEDNYSTYPDEVNRDYSEYQPEINISKETTSVPVQEISLTKKDIDAYQKEMDTQFANLKTQVESAGSVNSTVGYISIAAIFISVVACVIIYFVRSTLLSRTNELTKKITTQNSEIEKLKSEVAELTNTVGILKNKSEKQRQSEYREKFEISTVSSPIGNYSTTEKVTPQPRPMFVPATATSKFSNFVQEFNALSGQTGYNSIQATNEFVRKFNIQAFNCINSDARMNEPVPPPVFDSTSQQNADYWAYEFETGVYAVVPKVKNYSETCHAARAMGEIFKSNFRQGETYNKIFVVQPAIFKGKWNFETQGELRLS